MKKKAPIQAFSFDGSIQVQPENDGTHPVTLNALSGEPLNHWWWGQVVLDIQGMSHKDKIMIDWCHDDNEELGFVNKFNQGDELTLEGQLVSLSESDRAARIVQLAEKGVPYEASIFFPSSKPGDTKIEELGAGESAEVNGNTVHGPRS